MPAAVAQACRFLRVFFLAGLVLLVSSQHALRDPRSQVLPVSFLPGADYCTFPAQPSHTQSTPSPTHTHQPHCPLCVVGGFSCEVAPLVSLPVPVPWVGEGPKPLEAAQPPVQPIFLPRNRGPPQLG